MTDSQEIEDRVIQQENETDGNGTPVSAPPQVKRAKGDPRDDSFVIKYEKANFQKGDSEGGMAEFYQLISVVVGMLAFMLKYKWACWVALFFFYTSTINAKAESRLQHMFTGMSIIMISFVNMYLAPRPPAPAPKKID